jgi:HK97 family phage major capsid protein
MLFPEYKAQSNIPEWIKRDTTWADVVMAGVKKVPFKRLKSMFANITEDEARAKGYIKGDQKAPEVFELLGRTTDPQTIYKLQQLDRDDIIDIEDFDVVAWIKGEMQIMLNEEKARAILIGDGRTAANRYKIKEDHVRSIVNDVPLFNIKVDVPQTGDLYKNFIKSVLRARKNYKGSGNPTLFTTEEVLTELLLLEDQIGHPLYKTEAELATKLRVSRIVTVEVMEGQQVDNKPLMGVIVNLNDYTIGGDGNREKGIFEDFDIDFNQYKYLIETRLSGALMRPYSAMTIMLNKAVANGNG